ncbi:MAG: putative porin [Candidatus Omnitrophica bacterium]|nr:putative porin [Candidatus Omnitrophota bacterium]
MKKVSKFLFALTFTLNFFFFANLVFAGEVDVLINKLVEKGILTKTEAQQVATEAKEEARKEAIKGSYAALPSWVQNLKLKGDLRLRYQWEDKSSATGSSPDRHRGRYRFRLGLESEVNDQLIVAAGLATGSSDPRSTNQTMTDTFGTPDIRLDYAYAEWSANPWMTLRGGKVKSIKKEIFRPSDLLWDSDIHPEGLTIALDKKVNDTNLFANNAFWVLGESSSDTSDPVMWVVQPGFKTKLSDDVKLTAAVAGYFFDNVKGATLNHSAESNTLENGVLKYNYNSVSPSIQLDIKEPFNIAVLDKMSLFGDFVYNPDPSDKNQGWLAGVKFKMAGPLKIFGKKWDLKYMYRHLEKDAWLDTFPDSDAQGGATDVKGHEVAISYPLGKNTSLGLDYYLVQNIDATDPKRRHVLQVDWEMKF